MRVSVVLAIGYTIFACTVCPAEVIEVEDRDEWGAMVESFDTIDFTGFSAGSLVTNQFALDGVIFTDGHDFIDHDHALYPNDGEGLYGGFAPGRCQVQMDLRADQYWVGVEISGRVRIHLYHDGKLLFRSLRRGGEAGSFFGLVSDEPFDEVYVEDNAAGTVFIDDLHFGPPICVADLNGDTVVGFDDLVALLSAWANKGGPEDLDANGTVDFDDLLALLDTWGSCE